jgi:8-oxo-dGTP pyrophosphatase MutT (NUDIX family)
MTTKTEVSSGGVIVRVRNEKQDVLLLKDMNGNWTFPKGLVEPQEDVVAAAKREIAEETGISDLTLVAPLQEITYWYVRNGEKIHKIVHYFLFTTQGEEALIPQKEEGICEVEFIPYQKALEQIGYRETNVELLKEAITLL